MIEEVAADSTPSVSLMHLQEDELVRRAQAGEGEAFGVLLIKLESPVRRFVWRLLGTHDAEDDIVQDVFLALYNNLHRVNAAQGVRPYVYRITRNRAYDELRKLKRREMISLDDEPVEAYASLNAVPDSADEPEEVAHWLLIQLEVREAIDHLPEAQRQALILYSEEELSYAEIAEIMDTSLGTVKSRLYHAKQTLRRLLRPETLHALDGTFG
jgi:RNA polymerase sigma-70 factor (ECF subfamily)